MTTRDLGLPDILFIKADTSGFYRADLSIDDPGQPWCMQLAAALSNPAGTITQFFCHLIKSEGRLAKENAIAIHGISPRATDQVGIPQRRVLGCLTEMLKTAPLRGMKVVTFGDFEPKIIASLLARFAVELGKLPSEHDKLWLSRPLTTFIDIQKPYAQMICKLPGEFDDGSYKWPTLDEAAQNILGRPARGGEHHDAFEDLLTIHSLYFELAKRGYVERSNGEVATA
jgi:hypothetical protein